jgi:hypothetical protein
MARIGDSRLVYGTEDELWGYIQNLKIETSAETTDARNGEGNKVAVEMFNIGEEKVSGSFYFLTGMLGGPADSVGSITGCTIDGATGTVYIEKSSATRSVGNWKVIDFEGTYYPHLVNS